MQLSLLVDSASRDRWHEGTDEVSGPDAEASSVLMVNSLRIGIDGRFEGRVSLPYAWLDARDAGGRAETSGVGDLLTELRWNGYRGEWDYGFSAGSYWPVGELGSEGLPTTATFSTKTVDPTFGGHISGPPVSSFGWSFSTMTRLVVGEQDNGRKLGSTVTSSFAIDRKIGSHFSGQVQFIHFFREEDEGMAMESSGGNWLYLSPVLSYRLLSQRNHSLQTTLGMRIPLLQDVVGRQLVESPAFNFGMGYTTEF